MTADGLGDIWVITEQRDGHTKAASYALIGKARKLADECRSKVAAVCLSQGVEDAGQLAAFGADKVYLLDGPVPDGWNDDAYVKELVDLARRDKPGVILASSGSLGFIGHSQGSSSAGYRRRRQLHLPRFRRAEPAAGADAARVRWKPDGQRGLSEQETADGYRSPPCLQEGSARLDRDRAK